MQTEDQEEENFEEDEDLQVEEKRSQVYSSR